MLGSTIERIGLPDDIVARVDGKSSLGRLGILIHATAGFIDAGFNGQITLELSNVATLPIRLWPGMKIGQISFMRIDEPVERPYGHPDLGSKYQGQSGPVASEYRHNRRSTGLEVRTGWRQLSRSARLGHFLAVLGRAARLCGPAARVGKRRRSLAHPVRPWWTARPRRPRAG